jgi:hypothetical protein
MFHVYRHACSHIVAGWSSGPLLVAGAGHLSFFWARIIDGQLFHTVHILLDFGCLATLWIGLLRARSCVTGDGGVVPPAFLLPW